MTEPGRAAQLDQLLAGLLQRSPEIDAAAVVSFDGLPMASSLPPGMDEARVAAMSAALLSLGERAAEGLGRGDLSQVYIEGTDGTVFLVSADGEAVLVAVAGVRAKPGLVLYELRHCAVTIGRALRAEFDAPPAAAVPSTPAAASVSGPGALASALGNGHAGPAAPGRLPEWGGGQGSGTTPSWS